MNLELILIGLAIVALLASWFLSKLGESKEEDQ